MNTHTDINLIHKSTHTAISLNNSVPAIAPGTHWDIFALYHFLWPNTDHVSPEIVRIPSHSSSSKYTWQIFPHSEKMDVYELE